MKHLKISRATDCRHQWTVQRRFTSWCWTAGRRRERTGQAFPASWRRWTSSSAVRRPWGRLPPVRRATRWPLMRQIWRSLPQWTPGWGAWRWEGTATTLRRRESSAWTRLPDWDSISWLSWASPLLATKRRSTTRYRYLSIITEQIHSECHVQLQIAQLIIW